MEKGSNKVCPPQTPILRFADNEAHSNRRHGFRVSAGRSTGQDGDTRASGLGFSPLRNPCQQLSIPDNPYLTSQFIRLYSWRNGFAGVFISNVAAVHFIVPTPGRESWSCLTPWLLASLL